MATEEAFQALTERVTKLETLTRRLLKTLCQIQPIFQALTQLRVENPLDLEKDLDEGQNRSIHLGSKAASELGGGRTTSKPRHEADPAAPITSEVQLDPIRSASRHNSTTLFANSAIGSRPSHSGLFASTPAISAAAAPTSSTRFSRSGTSEPNLLTASFGSQAGATEVSSLDKSATSPTPRSKLFETVTSSPLNPNKRPATSPVRDIGGSEGRAYMQPYTYKDLDTTQNQIRLLAVQKCNDFTAPVTCRMIVESLDALDASRLANRPRGGLFGGFQGASLFGRPSRDEPLHHQFSALSYTWGDSDTRGQIYVDYQVMHVNKSLEVAMRYMRNFDACPANSSLFRTRNVPDTMETFWWVDAVCINQDDVAEKNVQVGQMTRLYKCASLVHIWLGEAESDSDLALHLIKQIGYRPPASGPEHDDWLYIRRDNETHRYCGPGEQPRRLPEEVVIREDERVRHTTALRNFFGRPWFQRVWVRQEAALPEHLTVHCGSQSCSWEEIARTASVIDFMSSSISYNPLTSSKAELTAPSWIQAPTGIQQMVEMESIRTSTGRDGKTYLSLADLIVHTKQCQATDPRDKVFSMLGLVDPSYIRLKPDYTSDARRAWRQAVVDLLPISLDFLGACQNVVSENDLPSWVPDLSCAWRRYPFHCQKDTKRNPDLPNTSIVKHTSPKYHLSNDQMVLEIQGWHIDTVQELCTPHVLPNMSLNELNEVGNGWSNWLQGVCQIEKAQDHLIRMLLSLQGEGQNETFIFGNLLSDRPKFTPLKDRLLYQDPTFRRASRLLLPKGMHQTDKTTEPAIIALRRYGLGRKLAKFASGRCGLVPDDTVEGDIIVVFPACTWPHCLRRHSQDAHLIVGETALISLTPSTFPKIDPNDQLRIRLM